MRVAIVGGGMAGLTLARGLAHRGIEPVVVERMPATVEIEGPIMLPFQAYDALDEIGLLDALQAEGTEVPPMRDGRPVAIGVGRQVLLERLRQGIDVLFDHEVIDLLRDGDRMAGVMVRDADGRREIAADIVVGADGTHSGVRELAEIEATLTLSDTAFVGFRSPVRGPEPF
ncbi:MAG: FAD-dependent oxidoreductase, partial [Miltoncostaeaceae bacterium]